LPKVTEVLRDAQALALFANLEPQHIDFFRNNYPDFVPKAWWDYTPTRIDSAGKHVPSDTRQWQMNQRTLREAWGNGFKNSLYYLVGLTMTVFDPEDLAAIGTGLTDERPAIADLSEVGFGYHPHQKAVLYLFEQPWRARFCAECKTRFVAAAARNKYCSETCSHENRNRQKREWFTRSGSGQRAARKAKRKRIASTVKRRAKRT
jgi:hypothetical protein